MAAVPSCGSARPWRIGFLGDLARSTAGDGLEGRNGAILAIEQINAGGGIRGRHVDLVVQDEGRSPQATQAATQALITAGVDAIVGPFTSASASAALPLVDAERILMLSPTATAASLAGRDDHLIRINRTTRDNARDYAQMLHRLGQRRVAVAFDRDNATFSESWLETFRSAFATLAGEVATAHGYRSSNAPAFSEVIAALLASRPDGLLFISNSFDAAHLAQQARKRAPELPLAAAEWAAYAPLVEFGGEAVDGLLLAQSYDPMDTSPAYRQFHTRFEQRFAREPGFNAVATVDAVKVFAQALARATPGETPRDAVLRHGPYDGLQQPIVLDRFGDAARNVHFLRVREGHFIRVP